MRHPKQLHDGIRLAALESQCAPHRASELNAPKGQNIIEWDSKLVQKQIEKIFYIYKFYFPVCLNNFISI